MMGSVESKVESKTEEQGAMLLLPSPSSSSATIAESLDEDLGKITLQEKPDGGGLTHEDTGLEESPTLEMDMMPSHDGKSERPHYPQRPGEPDCSFYLKTGSCRYGSNCKFDHPLRRKRNKAKSKKQSETIQKAAKEKENDTSSEKVGTEGKEVMNEKQNDALSKMMEQNNGKDVKEKEKATPLETVGKEEYQKAAEEKETPSEREGQTRFRKAVKEKENGSPSEKVGIEGKKVMNEKQNEALSKRLEQKYGKDVKEKQKATQSEMVGKEEHKAAEEEETPSEKDGQTKFKAAKEKENESPSKKAGKTEGKRVMNEKQNEALSKRMEQKNGKDDNEKQKTTPLEMVGKEGYKACKGKQDKTPPKMMDQKDHKKAVEEKETPSEREGRTKLKKAAKEKETPSEKLGRTEGKTVMNEKQNEALSRRMEQKNGKEVKEKATPSETMGNEGYKSGKGKQDKTLSRMMDQTDHKNYSMPGACKSGKACKFTHFNGKSEVAQVELNFLGLPMRPGESVCSYYMRTGGCKYATNCRYHHPDPTAVVGDSTISRDQTGGSAQEHASGASALPITSWPLHGNSSQPVPFFAPGFLPFPPQGLYPNPEWNVYQAPVLTPPNLNTRNSAASEVHQVDEYPERPGQPECHYFMRSGECKFKLACRFHHPRGRPQKDLPVRISPP